MGNDLNQPVPKAGVCDSCNATGQVYAVKHAQPGNDHVWYYCLTCWRAHYKNQLEQKFLEDLRTTHPNDVDNPQVLKIFHENNDDVNAVRRHLDQNKQPVLEAEVAR